MRRIAPVLAAVSLLALPAPAVAGDGDVLVRFKASADAGERADARRDADVRREAGLPVAGLEVVDPEADVSVGEAVRALDADPDVLYAEPDARRFALATRPDDDLFGAQWALENTGQIIRRESGAPDADIDAPEAWDVVTGDSSIVVAVIDSGLADHPDLIPNRYVNSAETGGNRVDDDDNGFVDDVSGWDFAEVDNDPQDADGHGTHVAGTVAARGNDGYGVTGVAWRASILPVRALGADGSGNVSDVVAAYDYAVSMGAPIVNLSLGGPRLSRSERDTIALADDVLFVAAAGNEAADNDDPRTPSYPCNHELANVVCVAASDRFDRLAGFSNTGARTVDLAAPGVSIASTWLDREWALLDGTSMATPHVAGAAALLLARTPTASVATLRSSLLDTVDPQPDLAGKTVTGGRLNVASALGVVQARADAQPVPATPPPGPPPAPAPAVAPPATTATSLPRDRSGPYFNVAASPTRSLATLLRRGLRVRVGCRERCTLRLALRRGRTTIATGRAARTSAGTAVVTLRLSARRRAQLRRLRTVRLELRTTATDGAGNRRTVTRRLTLRR